MVFDYSINIALTFESGHDIKILKMAIFDKVDYDGIEPALMCGMVDSRRCYRHRHDRLST